MFYEPKKSKINNKAFTLIEVILVVAGITLLTIIAFNFYKKVEAKRIAKQEADLVLAAVSELRSQFPSGTVPFGYLARLNTYPKSRNISNGNAGVSEGVYMPWENGYAWSQPAGWDGIRASNGNLLKIEFVNMPKDICLNFIPKVANAFGRVEVVRSNHTCNRTNQDTCLIKNEYVVSGDMYQNIWYYDTSIYKTGVGYDAKRVADACSLEYDGRSLKTVRLYLR